MPMFSDPDRRPGQLLAGQVGLLLGMVGWATVAVGLSSRGLFIALALVGLGLHVAAARAQLFTVVGELVVVSASVAVVPPAARDWVWIGATVVGLARAIGYALSRLNHPEGS